VLRVKIDVSIYKLV